MGKCFFYTFEDNFIDCLADFILSHNKGRRDDLTRVACVFGGRRPSLFLRKALFERIGEVFFPPSIFSMDEFVEYLLSPQKPLNRINDLEATYFIYRVSQNVKGIISSGRKKFSEFFPWAKEIISFIDNLDLEDVEDKSLEMVQKSAAVGYDVPESVNSLLREIINIRGAYHDFLTREGLFSRGRMYRQAAFAAGKRRFDEFDMIIFANFFYLHRTEFKLMQEIYRAGKGIFIFQGDPEEWPVLKEHKKRLGVTNGVTSGKKRVLPSFHFYAAGDIHSQVSLVIDILRRIKNVKNTVIVLPRPSALIPLLSEISSVVEDFNVSLGYPLKRSSLFSLFEAIRHAQESRKGNLYYATDYLNLLRHPLIKNINFLFDASVTRVIVHKIEEFLKGEPPSSLGGSIFINLDDVESIDELYSIVRDTLRSIGISVSVGQLKKMVSVMHRILFREWENAVNIFRFCQAVDGLLEVIIRDSHLDKFPFNAKVAMRIKNITDIFKNLSFSQEEMGTKEVFALFIQKLSSEVVSFVGSPLKGLQILGLFETRSLNFDNVIVMDLNESVLPKLKLYEPLIPREVMVSLNINRLEEEEQIQRYQFMRLIGGAKDVHLIYVDNPSTEKSRFLEELIWRKQRRYNALDVVKIPRAVFPLQVTRQSVVVTKSEEMVEFLKNITYSASSVNTYLNCPLQFYYRYILGISEKEDLLEEPESVDIGTFLHELLEEGFQKFLGRKPLIDASFRREFMNLFEEKFSNTLSRRMKADSFLLKGILKNRLDKFLQKEAAAEGIKRIVCLEKDFYGEIKVKGTVIKLLARIDRIDEYQGDTLFVIDYKSGGVDSLPAKEKIFSMEFDRNSIYDAVKSFQLPLYSYLVQKEFPEYRVVSGLYSLRTLEKKMFILPSDKDSFRIIDKCIESLRYILDEILNPRIPFVPERDDKRCRFCPFASTCT